MRWLVFFLVAVVAATGLLLVTVSGGDSSSQGYPSEYVAALARDDSVVVQPAHLEPFQSFVTRMLEDDWETRFNAVYADELHFSDTLAVIDNRQQLLDYFRKLHAAGTTTQVRFLSEQLNDRDAYLVWEMHSEFDPGLSTQHSHTIGITHLRFNAEGKVILHQDFWDAAHGFYQHLPVLGAAIRSIRSRLQPEPTPTT